MSDRYLDELLNENYYLIGYYDDVGIGDWDKIEEIMEKSGVNYDLEGIEVMPVGDESKSDVKQKVNVGPLSKKIIREEKWLFKNT